MRYYSGEHNRLESIIKLFQIDKEIVFFVRNIKYMINAKESKNSRGTTFRAYIKAEDDNNYYVVLCRGQLAKNNVAATINKNTLEVIEVMYWHEMQAKYLSKHFTRLQSNSDRIEKLRSKQAELKAEIDRLQMEIDSLSE